MSPKQDFAFSPPTPTEPLRLYKHSHKVNIEERYPRESQNAYVQDAKDMSQSAHQPRLSPIRNRDMEESQMHHESRPETSISTESLTSSISSGWRSSYNTESNSSSHLLSGSTPTILSSHKAQYIPDSPGGVMGNFIPMDTMNMTCPQESVSGGRQHVS